MMNKEELGKGLGLLGEILKGKGIEVPFRLLICGGSALILSDLIERITKDVDILALGYYDSSGKISFKHPEVISLEFQSAAGEVSDILGWPKEWVNLGPADLMRHGLPKGFEDRVLERKFGPVLIIYFLGRFDLIHLKLYAAVDQGPGKHLEDLLKLNPSPNEIKSSSVWAMIHDSSPGFRLSLKQMLEVLGYGSIAEEL